MMQCNVGNTDRALRLVAGVLIICLGLVFNSWWGLLGIVPLLTGTLRWCPLYIPIGFSSAKKTN